MDRVSCKHGSETRAADTISGHSARRRRTRSTFGRERRRYVSCMPKYGATREFRWRNRQSVKSALDTSLLAVFDVRLRSNIRPSSSVPRAFTSTSIGVSRASRKSVLRIQLADYPVLSGRTSRTNQNSVTDRRQRSRYGVPPPPHTTLGQPLSALKPIRSDRCSPGGTFVRLAIRGNFARCSGRDRFRRYLQRGRRNMSRVIRTRGKKGSGRCEKNEKTEEKK